MCEVFYKKYVRTNENSVWYGDDVWYKFKTSHELTFRKINKENETLNEISENDIFKQLGNNYRLSDYFDKIKND